MDEGLTCYARDAEFCEDQMCLRTGCRLETPTAPSKDAAARPSALQKLDDAARFAEFSGKTAWAESARRAIREARQAAAPAVGREEIARAIVCHWCEPATLEIAGAKIYSAQDWQKAKVNADAILSLLAPESGAPKSDGLTARSSTGLERGASISQVAGSSPAAQATPAPGSAEPVAWQDPTPEMLAEPRFIAIWKVIRSWDIAVPGRYSGYCGATGSHARAILDALTGDGVGDSWWKVLADNWRGRHCTLTGDAVRDACADELEKCALAHLPHPPTSEVADHSGEAAELVALREALTEARRKLVFYRNTSCGEYQGGMEYTQLMRLIDAALTGEGQ